MKFTVSILLSLFAIPSLFGTVFSLDFDNLDDTTKTPEWIIEVSESGGELIPDVGWQVKARKPFGIGQIVIAVDRQKIRSDFAMVVGLESDSQPLYVVQLADSKGRLLAASLYTTELKLPDGHQVTTLIVPFSLYPEATQIVLARLEGGMTIPYLSLFPIEQPLKPEEANLQALATALGAQSNETDPLTDSLTEDWEAKVDWQAAQKLEATAGRTLLELSTQATNEPISETELLQLLQVLGLQGYGFNAIDFVEAAGQGKVEVLGLYLRAGMPINSQGRNRYTAIAEAATSGELRAIKFLAEQGADLEIRTAGGNSALAMAAMNNHLEATHLLVQFGADLNAKGSHGITPLGKAYSNHTNRNSDASRIFHFLLESGADPNVADHRGRTILHKAAGGCYCGILPKLLEHGADFSKADNHGLTPLQYAVVNGKSTNEKLLIKAGAEPWEANPSNPDEQLVLAIYQGNSNAVRKALEDGANPNANDYFGNPIIVKTAAKKNQTLCKLLLDAGASIEARDSYGQTPLNRLSGDYSSSREDFIRFLLIHGADPNYMTKEDLRRKNPYWTPLMRAANSGNRERCLVLLQYGADPTIKNLPGRTAATIAERNGFLTLAEELRKAEAVWNTENNNKS